MFHLLPTAQKLVRFYSKKEGLLATYETIKGQILIVIQKHGDLGVQDDARTGNEIYDLVLVEKKEVTQSEYWCTLEEATFGVTESAHWIEEPVVRFTSTKVNATTRLGTCSLENFEPSGKDYSVQFWSESGLKVVNRLASFAVRRNFFLSDFCLIF